MESLSFKETKRFLPYRLGRTARETLQEFIDIDVTAEDMVRILHHNQAYKDLFARFVQQQTRPRKTEEGEEGKEAGNPTHRLIGLLGMIGSRNLILSLRMHKATEGRFPVTAEGLVEIKASDYLPRAQETEELFSRNKLEYSETAFAAAVYFDWGIRRLSLLPDFKKTIEPFATAAWKRAQRTGMLAYLLAREIPSISPKQALAAGFLCQGGKLWMLEQTNGAYGEFDAKLAENERLDPFARMLQERARWGLSQEEAGSQTLRYFDVFAPILRAVRHFREPYCLKGVDLSLYKLSALLYLAEAMAQSWKLPANDKDPVLQEWNHPSTTVLRLSPKKLIQAMKTAMNLR